MSKKIIKCSQCEEEFENGYDYRMHWEKHFDKFLEDKRNATLSR